MWLRYKPPKAYSNPLAQKRRDAVQCLVEQNLFVDCELGIDEGCGGIVCVVNTGQDKAGAECRCGVPWWAAKRWVYYADRYSRFGKRQGVC